MNSSENVLTMKDVDYDYEGKQKACIQACIHIMKG